MAQHILLLDTDIGLFFSCFGKHEDWPDVVRLAGDCPDEELHSALDNANLICCVVQDVSSAARLKDYYDNGGYIVYFGIEGEFAAPAKLGSLFGLQWTFSGYSSYDYILTSAGKEIIGDAVTQQHYTKANLIQVPPQDQVLVAKHCSTLQEYLSQYLGWPEESFLPDGTPAYHNDRDEMEEYESARDRKFPEHQKEMGMYCPLALHTAPHGGRLCYLGFVNGSGDVPKFVKAVVTQSKTV